MLPSIIGRDDFLFWLFLRKQLKLIPLWGFTNDKVSNYKSHMSSIINNGEIESIDNCYKNIYANYPFKDIMCMNTHIYGTNMVSEDNSLMPIEHGNFEVNIRTDVYNRDSVVEYIFRNNKEPKEKDTLRIIYNYDDKGNISKINTWSRHYGSASIEASYKNGKPCKILLKSYTGQEVEYDFYYNRNIFIKIKLLNANKDYSDYLLYKIYMRVIKIFGKTFIIQYFKKADSGLEIHNFRNIYCFK